MHSVSNSSLKFYYLHYYQNNLNIKKSLDWKLPGFVFSLYKSSEKRIFHSKDFNWIQNEMSLKFEEVSSFYISILIVSTTAFRNKVQLSIILAVYEGSGDPRQHKLIWIEFSSLIFQLIISNIKLRHFSRALLQFRIFLHVYICLPPGDTVQSMFSLKGHWRNKIFLPQRWIICCFYLWNIFDLYSIATLDVNSKNILRWVLSKQLFYLQTSPEFPKLSQPSSSTDHFTNIWEIVEVVFESILIIFLWFHVEYQKKALKIQFFSSKNVTLSALKWDFRFPFESINFLGN